MNNDPMNRHASSTNRRQFLQKTTTGITAVAAIAQAPFFINRAAADHHNESRLGFALVGLGGLATNQLAPAFAKTKHCRLSGVVSGTPAKIERWQKQYHLPAKNCYAYDTYDQIADNPDIDVIYIVLPNSMHAEYTIRAAQLGKHVLCEKPMANSAADCEAMIAACEQADRKLAIGYRCQFEPHHHQCIRFAQEETFGSIKMIEAGFGFKIGNPNQWRLKKSYAGGGALMDVGIYAIQACRYLAGEEPIEISATETKTDPVKFSEVDESITWSMKFKNGLNAYCSTTYAFNGINRFTAYGNQGWFGLNPAYAYNGITGTTSKHDAISFPAIDQFAAEMDDFALCIKNNRRSRVSGEEGLRDLWAIEAIYDSIQNGNTIHLS
ncbi:MAG: Glucose--fructose oxidoreductase [Verrucomicrobia subdivision 3 bacterium]|nr:Glucose--fructose oxidoreductase [Limisphaerales bacterium]MCS1415089.1 Glucose--fructose oxidoreductase [Limisphaerales bacterium]